MESDVRRLDLEDLLNIISDRFATGIGEGSDEQQEDWKHAETYTRRLRLIAEKYKIDQRHIR